MSRVRPTHPIVALSSAAVIAVYSAGYLKTRAAAAKFSDAPAMRRPAQVSASGPVVAAPTPQDLAPHVAAHSGPHLRPAAGAPAAPHRHAAEAPVEESSTGELNVAVAIRSGAHDELPAPPVSTDRSSLDLSATASVTIAAPPPAAPEAPAAKSLWRDGAYSGWGSSRHGDIQATVTVESGRITSARISQCLTRYSCSWIAHLPGQVVDRQSADVDYVSGATQSSNAFYGAIIDALSKASR